MNIESKLQHAFPPIDEDTKERILAKVKGLQMNTKMILGIELPEGAKVKVKNGKVFIMFDTSKTKRDLWKAKFYMWLTEGSKIVDFFRNESLSSKKIEVTRRNKLR